MIFIRIFFLIVILVFIVLLIKKSKKTSTVKNSSNNYFFPKFLIGVIVIIAVVIIVFVSSFVWNFTSSLFEKKIQPIKSTKVVNYDVPVNGISLYLHPGWKAFPSGKIKIITPKNSFTYDPASNENYYPGYLGEGWYYFYSLENQGIEVKVEDTF